MSDPAKPIAPVTIDVVSDVVCPWCFIGKRRLARALEMRPEIAFDVQWRPYQLDPNIPREGMTRDEYLTTKFGSPDKYTAILKSDVPRPFVFDFFEFFNIGYASALMLTLTAIVFGAVLAFNRLRGAVAW